MLYNMENEMKNRIGEAIDRGPAKAADIARFCKVTPQSVHKWRASGSISKENLQRLSEITGYRYTWLLTGKGPKTFEHDHSNVLNEEIGVYISNEANAPAYMRLQEAIRLAIANHMLTEDAADHLAAMLTALVDAKR